MLMPRSTVMYLLLSQLISEASSGAPFCCLFRVTHVVARKVAERLQERGRGAPVGRVGKHVAHVRSWLREPAPGSGPDETGSGCRAAGLDEHQGCRAVGLGSISCAGDGFPRPLAAAGYPAARSVGGFFPGQLDAERGSCCLGACTRAGLGYEIGRAHV